MRDLQPRSRIACWASSLRTILPDRFGASDPSPAGCRTDRAGDLGVRAEVDFTEARKSATSRSADIRVPSSTALPAAAPLSWLFVGPRRTLCQFFHQFLLLVTEYVCRANVTVQVNLAERVMKVDSPKNMDQVAGMCCRQSPLRGLVGGLIFCAVLIGLVFLLRHGGVPWFVWGWCAVWAALLEHWILADALAKFRSANWLLRLGPDGLWINLRSYQNGHLPEAATVLHLRYEEIASAHRHLDTWSTPSEPSSNAGTHWKQESLELSLVSGETREIAKALAEERGRRATIKGKHQAVTVPAAGVVRIAWRGNNNDVVPPLTRVLDELSRRVKVDEPTRTDRAHWRELSEAELDELVAQLVRSGDDWEAAQLLKRRRGCSATEAHQFVEEQASRI
jgi:hypothetical protein